MPWLRTLLVFGLLAGTAAAADWPQFLGPNRDGVSTETGLLAHWRKDGPPQVWDRPVGAGFSAPVVQGGRLFVATCNLEGAQAQKPTVVVCIGDR